MRKIILSVLVLLPMFLSAQYINRDGYTIWYGRMGVGNPSTTAPLGGAWLTIGADSTTKGMVIPRTVSTAAIVTPAKGMIVYSISDSSVKYYTGNQWLAVGLRGNSVDSITRTSGVDSFYWWKNGASTAVLDSVGTGSGGSSDSSFVQAEFGTAPTTIGTLINETFSAGSIPSGWTKGSGITTSYAGAKLNVIGAGSIGAPAAGSYTTAFTSAMQYDTKRIPYEKVEMVITVVPSTKSSGAIIGMCKGVLGSTLYSQEGIYWDLSNGTNSGRVTLGTNAVPTFITSTDSTSKASFSTGDTLQLYFKRDGFGVTAGIYNKTTGIRTVTYFNQRWNGSGGRWNFIFMNGTYDVTGIKVSSFERKGGVWFFGDSQTGGYGNSQTSRRYPNLVMNNNDKYFAVLGLPSLSAKYADLGDLVDEIIADAQPGKAIVALGYNDESEAFTAPLTKVYVDSIVRPLITYAGASNVSIMGIVPRNSATDIYNDSLSALATTRGVNFYNIRTPLIDASSRYNVNYFYDGVHVNDSGAIVVANVVTAKAGNSLLATTALDSSYTVNMYGLQTGQVQSVNTLIGMKPNGGLVAIPNNLPNATAWIQNKYTNLTSNAQLNSQIHIDQPIISDSALFVHNSRGLYLGGNGGSYNAAGSGTNGSNIVMSTRGIAGNGYPQAFPTVTGLRNIVFEPQSLKTGAAVTYSGNDNFIATMGNGGVTALSGNRNTLINTGGNTFQLTSADDNILIGQDAGRAITTGDNNTHLIARNSGGASFAAALTGTTIIGDILNNTGGGLIPANYDVWLSAGNSANDQTFRFGGLGGAANIYFDRSPTFQSSNRSGDPWYLRSSRGYGTGTGGSIIFQTWNAGSTGTTINSTARTELTISHKAVTVANRLLKTQGADVASTAGAMTLGNDGNTFEITGTNSITLLSNVGWQNGSEVTLMFTGAATLVNGTATSGTNITIKLAGAANFVASADDTITLVLGEIGGTQAWREKCRSVN